MEVMSLDTVLKNRYDLYVSFIKSKNIELEREYFSVNADRIPMGEIMQGASYEDHFMYCKDTVKNDNEYEIDRIFVYLQEYFLFSYGHDMMFKTKLKADIFTSTPMDNFLYPKLVEAVNEKYNDVSVMEENPNLHTTIEGIDKLIHTYTDIQSLLYLLYCNDFQFPDGWEEMFPDTCEEILSILNNSEITIGDFLQGLVDFKCGIMSDIFSEIRNKELRAKYLEKVENLKKEKKEDVGTFATASLPITYFSNHTISDFIHMKHESTILEKPKAKKAEKILLPKV